MFRAPEGSESFYEDVVAKSEKYISIGYWDDIELLNLRSWLTNFETSEEKYFAACLLDSLVYRSRRMVNSCIDEVVISRIPNFLRANNIEEITCISSWLERLCRGEKIPFRFIAIEDVDKKAGKSGAVLSRRVDERLNLAGHLTRKLDDFEAMNEEVKAVVLIDDFAGTGEQFASYMEKVARKENYHKYCYLYVPLAACKTALTTISNKFPNVTVDPIELLDEEDNFFHPIDGYFRGDKENTVGCAKNFYLEMCRSNGFGNTKYLMGKGDLSLTFGFDFSTPNNNLKLLYHNPTNKSWKNLLVRRQ